MVGLIVRWAGLDQQNIATLLERAGPLGPIAIVGLMTLAVVISPLPSAPIAVAAGAAFGHVLGTGLVLAGALAGAMIAFALARSLGRVFVARWVGSTPDAGLLGSQNFLTWTVFVSRLVPFVSFDLVSYAAGMSALRPWRFVLATLAGTGPASFGLAHLGSALSQPASGGVFWPVLALGLLTGVPVIWAAWRSRRVPGLADADGSPTQSTKVPRRL
ncbi:VTT domain-containing protein (plasmid) [Aliisedimentitalea scapharcae]|uniref:TVP38/TMEM64 family membrane protein n=2 Tax=Aliisedimentitalea scapharcae TaxID=1524259 RepID=A0ABZ2Y3H4_9RHOB